MNAYLLALSALIIVGGSLGDLYGRRGVRAGLLGFAGTSSCARGTERRDPDRGAGTPGCSRGAPGPGEPSRSSKRASPRRTAAARSAPGRGWSGVSSLIGPFVGGWLVDARRPGAGCSRSSSGSRWPRRGSAPATSPRAGPREPRRRAPTGPARPGQPRGSRAHSTRWSRAGGPGPRRPGGRGGRYRRLRAARRLRPLRAPRRRADAPARDLPLAPVLRGANAATIANYLAIGALFFFLSLQLQNVLGYSALAAGAASFPATLSCCCSRPRPVASASGSARASR